MGECKYILDDAGDPIPCADLLQWALWFETAQRHVADDRINGVRVSTVFLGLDHSFSNGPPILYETMIFGGRQDQEQWRYQDSASARRHHRRLVERTRKRFLRKRLHPDDQRARSKQYPA